VESTGKIIFEMERAIKQAIVVVLQKEPDMKLGITIEPSHGNQYLKVLGLTGEGTICQKFTDAFPNVGIKVGDVIVQVDETGGAEAMIGALSTFMQSDAVKAVTVYIERK
jgi:hypothetical protein